MTTTKREFPEQVTDMEGRVYHLKKKIGEGGQGVVFLAKEKGFAIKLIRSTPMSGKYTFADKNKIATYQKAFRRIKRLPLDGVYIAYPIAVLEEPYVGYVMEIIEDMIPLCDYMFDGSGVLIPEDEESFKKYNQGGGFKRRLKLLGNIAKNLSQLHCSGIVFADPSPNNFFISRDNGEHDICLIDADNLEYQSRLKDRFIYTPPFGAPELVKGSKGVSTLTDAHAFAVISFWLLVGVHPLYSDAVQDGGPEMEEKAIRGEFPWGDNFNSSSTGMPIDVLSKKLIELFYNSFGEGLNDYLKRPGIAEWEKVLFDAGNELVECECGFHYFVEKTVCPLCEAVANQTFSLELHSWMPQCDNFEGGIVDKQYKIAALNLVDNESLILTSRHTQGNVDHEEDVLEIQYLSEKKQLQMRNLDNGIYYIGDEKLECVEKIGRIKKIDMNTKNIIHFGNKDNYHRVLTFS